MARSVESSPGLQAGGEISSSRPGTSSHTAISTPERPRSVHLLWRMDVASSRCGQMLWSGCRGLARITVGPQLEDVPAEFSRHRDDWPHGSRHSFGGIETLSSTHAPSQLQKTFQVQSSSDQADLRGCIAGCHRLSVGRHYFLHHPGELPGCGRPDWDRQIFRVGQWNQRRAAHGQQCEHEDENGGPSKVHRTVTPRARWRRRPAALRRAAAPSAI